jgi:hypothetical protein
LRLATDGYFQFVERNREGWRLLFGGGAAIAGSAAEKAEQLRFDTVGRTEDLPGPFLSDLDQAELSGGE